MNQLTEISRLEMLSFRHRDQKSGVPLDEQGKIAASTLSYFLSREDWHYYLGPHGTDTPGVPSGDKVDSDGKDEEDEPDKSYMTTTRWSEKGVEALLKKVSFGSRRIKFKTY